MITRLLSWQGRIGASGMRVCGVDRLLAPERILALPQTRRWPELLPTASLRTERKGSPVNSRRRSATAALAACLLLVPAGPAAALGTLDQSQTDTAEQIPTSAVFPFSAGVCQIFTAGLSGQLDTVSLVPVTDLNGATISIRTLDPATGTPSNTVLASTTLSTPTTPDAWVQVPFAIPASVMAGTQYAIVILGTVETLVMRGGHNPPFGLLCQSHNSGRLWIVDTILDLAFETYVTQQATPTPTATPSSTPPPSTSLPAAELPNTATHGGDPVPISALGLVLLASSAALLRIWGSRGRVSRR